MSTEAYERFTRGSTARRVILFKFFEIGVLQLLLEGMVYALAIKRHTTKKMKGRREEEIMNQSINLKMYLSIFFFSVMKGRKKEKKEKKEKKNEKKEKKKEKKNKNEDADINQQLQTQTIRWSGKTPMTWLNEFCQKQKNFRPDYSQKRVSKEGFLFQVHVGNKENMQCIISSKPGKNIQLAKNFAATTALFRLRPDIPMHRLLEPTYCELWKALGTEYKETQRMAAEAADAVEAMEVLNKKQKRPYTHHIQKLLMNQETRNQIDLILRDCKDLYQSRGMAPRYYTRNMLKRKLHYLGFSMNEIQEALKHTPNSTTTTTNEFNFEAVLDWLCSTIPEAELPGPLNPNCGSIEVIFGKETSFLKELESINHELWNSDILKNTLCFGFRPHEIKKAIANYDRISLDTKTIDYDLFYYFLCFHLLYPDTTQLPALNTKESSPENITTVEEEKEILFYIFENIELLSPKCLAITQIFPPVLSSPLTIHFHLTSTYPKTFPAIVFHSFEKNCHVDFLRFLTYNMLREATKICNEPMILSLMNYIKDNFEILFNEFSSPSKAPKTHITMDSKYSMYTTNTTTTTTSLQCKPPQMRTTQQKVAPFKPISNFPSHSHATNLPAFKHRKELIKFINSHPIVIIRGDTGCGKSTQIPQIIFNSLIKKGKSPDANILISQPRRIATIGVAERVAFERSEIIGQSIGYSIRGITKSSVNTQVLFCTTGIILQKMKTPDFFHKFSHIIIDEVHERNLDIDLLLLIIKHSFKVKKNSLNSLPKIILMSATIDTTVLSSYFSHCPVYNIPGKHFPIRELFLPEILRILCEKESEFSENLRGKTIDYRLIAKLVYHLANSSSTSSSPSSILVFVPGIYDIVHLTSLLNAQSQPAELLFICPCHSSLSPEQQKRIFPLPPPGKTKVVIATNIAETSITINDITTVIDTGRSKQISFNPHTNFSQLVEDWISQDAAKQRRGRAGRVSAGVCYRFYTQQQYNDFSKHNTPEMECVPLENLCLKCLLMPGRKNKTSISKSLSKFLSYALTSPPQASLDLAIALLFQIGALEVCVESGEERLTPLGMYIAHLPVDIRLGKLLLFGAFFRCLDPILTISAILSDAGFLRHFSNATLDDDNIKHLAKSDHLLAVKIFTAWKSCSEKSLFSRRTGIPWPILKTISQTRRLLRQELKGLGVLSNDENYNSHNLKLVRSLLCAGLYPNVIKVDARQKKYYQSAEGAISIEQHPSDLKFTLFKSNERVFAHPQSTLASCGKFETPYLLYFQKLKTSRNFVLDLTMPSAYSLLFFGGDITINPFKQLVFIDNWIIFQAPLRIALLCRDIKLALNTLLLYKIEDPNFDLACHPLVELIIKIIVFDGLL